MKYTIRPIEESDIGQVVQGWNVALIHNQVNEKWFEETILGDENHEKNASLVAVHDGQIIGFISSVTREGITGADNRGRPHEANRGYIKGFYVLENFRKQGIGTQLLDEVTKYLKSKGKSSIWVVVYTGRYFFPGVDLRYEDGVNFFENKGFRTDQIIDDVDLHLENLEVSDYQKNAQQRMAEFGAHVEDYDPLMLDRMREFVEKVNMPAWFPEGWEDGFKDKGNKVVAIKDGQIIGWASFGPRPGTAYFGPIAVLVEMRGNGIGSCLLLESILRIKDAGGERVIASWANTPFYLPNGWEICQQYAVFVKEWDN